MHQTCRCCDSELEQLGEPSVTADGDHVVERWKCTGCQRGGSQYRTPNGGVAGRIGPVFRSGYRVDARREPTTNVDHSRVATDGGDC